MSPPRGPWLVLNPHLFRKGGVMPMSMSMPTPTTSMPTPTTSTPAPEQSMPASTTSMPTRPVAAVPAPGDWQSPAYAVVDTALEVTAYRLADR